MGSLDGSWEGLRHSAIWCRSAADLTAGEGTRDHRTGYRWPYPPVRSRHELGSQDGQTILCGSAEPKHSFQETPDPNSGRVFTSRVSYRAHSQGMPSGD